MSSKKEETISRKEPSKTVSRQLCSSLTGSKANFFLVCRGLAIIGIFLHNYCHWLNSIVKENEYTYHQHNVEWLNRVLLHPDEFLPMHLLSFFGHYGVPVFLFLSGYGLVKKYEKMPQGSRKILQNSKTEALESQKESFFANLKASFQFLTHHFLKLFRMMLIGFTAFIIIDSITPGSRHYNIETITAQLLMVNNLLPQPDRVIWPGPYWFFGLMMQFYLLYRLALYRRHWAVTAVLMGLCVGIQLLLPPDGEIMNRYRYNFMGGMLPFGIGLLYARFNLPLTIGKPTGAKLLAGLLLFISLSFFLSQSFIGWCFAPIAICMATLYLAKLFVTTPLLHYPAILTSWIGTISAALFVTHPITRKLFIPLSRQGDMYTGFLLYIIASIAVAWLFHWLLKKIPNPTAQH